MSQKLKPNFTPVPNVILDEIMRTLAPGTTKLLFAICRFTYGWGKQSDRISISQLEDITGMAHGSVARSIKQLGKLVSIKPGNPSRQLASEYRLNIEISDNDLVSLRDQPLAARGRSPIFTKRTETVRSGDLGPQIVSDRVLGADQRPLGRAVTATE